MNVPIFSRKFFSIQYILVIAFGILLVASCKKDKCEPPVIDYITSILSTEPILELVPTRHIYIYGSNLNKLVSITVNDSITFTEESTTYSLFSFGDTAALIRVPIINSNDPDGDLPDFIRVSKSCGQDRISIKLLAAPPYIRKINNEYALPGETITVEGLYFDELYTDSVNVPSGATGGIVLSPYTDTLCQVTLPDADLGSGDLILVSKSGRGSSRTGVELHPTTGLICNFDDLDTYTGNESRVVNPDDFSDIPAANGNVFYTEVANLQPGAASDDSQQLLMDVDTDFDYSGALSPQFFALKLEMFVQENWESGYFEIELGNTNSQGATEYAYVMKYNPLSDTTLNGTFTTNGWETISIPINGLLLKGSTSTYLQSFAQIRTINYMKWTFHNQEEDNGGKPIDNLGIGMDNIRLSQVIGSSL